MKKVLALILALTLLLSAAVTASAATVLRPGDKGDLVKKVQQALNDAGYSEVKVDGVYGPTTVDAVKRYQKNNGLVADGKAGPKTLTKMLGAGYLDVQQVPGRYQKGDRNNDVKIIQTLLKALKYPVGTVDGIFGPKTEAAVRLFQSRNGLTADGIVGSETIAKLTDSSAKAYSKPVTYQKLKRGMSGAAVKKLQNALITAGYYTGVATGYYNADTEEAVVNFQRDNGLVDDGIAGQKTQDALYGT